MGTIYFYSKNEAQGSIFYSIDDRSGQSIDMKALGYNDVLRSFRLENAATGVIIKVYDHINGDTNDDWTEIEILKQVPSCVIGTFQRTYTDPAGVYRQVYHQKDGLDGRVSRVKTTRAAPLQLDYVALGKLFADDSWNDKGGLGCLFYSQDSWYRIYQPDTAPRFDSSGAVNGTIITGQVDHTRSNAEDDYCFFKIEIDDRSDGDIITTLDFKWATGSRIPGTAQKAGNAAKEVAYTIIEVAGYATGAGLLGCLVNVFALACQLAQRDNGGRLNFSAVVNHSINKILQATRGTRR
jgi:hypothetical protein